jgi:hypothetical protein
MVQDPAMADLQVTRWKRYGKDRLYVKDAADAELGWVNLLTGERTISDASRADAFTAAVNNWYVETARGIAPTAAGPAAPPHESAEPGPNVVPEQQDPEPAAPAWHDLATHVPGQAARQQALRELAAMRERTRVGTFLARTFDVKTDERAWRIGADGEETVGTRLEKLTKRGWHILHAVPVGSRGSDIDHVVIGWGGVYTLNTKTHPGKKVWVGAQAVRVDGQPVPYLRNSRHEAERAGRLLSDAVGFTIPIQPVLVFLTGTLIPNVTIKQNPPDVRIYDRTDIPGVFKRAPRRIDDEQIAAIYEVARRCTTWTGSRACTCTAADG